MLDEILFLGVHSDDALAAAALGAIKTDGVSLDVAGVRNRNRHVLLDDHVFRGDVARLVDNFRPTLVGEFFLHLPDFVLEDARLNFFVHQNPPKVPDRLPELLVFRFDFVSLQPGQTLEAHLEDRLGLNLSEAEFRHQPLAGDVCGLAPADELDHGVNLVERDSVAF